MIEFLFTLRIICYASELYPESHPKVSVILPVFNQQLRISFSLIHILNQTLKSLEVICVDDGSLDQTLWILKFFAEKDERIVVLHQKNCGLSCARNAGLTIAHGEYVTFVDSDDWIESNAYEIVYEKAKKHEVDLVICGYFYHANKILKYCSGDRVLLGVDAARFLLPYHSVTDCVWNKMYKRSLLKDNGVLFELNLKIGEDNLFNVDLIPVVKSILCVGEAFYHYTASPFGQSKTYTKDNLKAFLKSSTRHFNAIKNDSRCKWMTQTDLSKLKFYGSWKQLRCWGRPLKKRETRRKQKRKIQ